MTTAVIGAMSADEMIELCKKHSIYEWSAQSAVTPIPVARAKGVYFWEPSGKRYIDFNSQLMCVNIGHGDERVVEAIKKQAEDLPYANPFMATEPRARLGKVSAHGQGIRRMPVPRRSMTMGMHASYSRKTIVGQHSAGRNALRDLAPHRRSGAHVRRQR